MKLFSLISVLFTFNLAFSQSTSYADVAVIINDNSQSSVDIGNYFQQARSIPNQNMIHVVAPTTEDIDSAQFEQLRAQIENHLVSNNLVDSINYLVTTKGVPLKIANGCAQSNNLAAESCGSIDAELTLILGQYSNQINTNIGVNNPYSGNNATDFFKRSDYGIYLVTRLDGYSTQDVFNLIDRSGPNIGVNQQTVQNVVDLYDTVSPADSTYFHDFHLEPTYNFLSSNSWNTQVDYSYNVLTNLNNVFSCVHHSYAPPSSINLNYTWVEGSIATAPTGGSAMTFLDASNTQDYLLIADLIGEGCTGAYGNIGPIFYSEVLPSDQFLERYLNANLDYNLAESFYAEITRLSRHSIIVGDPKASIVIDNTASVIQLGNEDISVFPNPSNGIIEVKSNELIQSCQLYSLHGRRIYANTPTSSSFKLDLTNVPHGLYILILNTPTRMIQKKIVLEE